MKVSYYGKATITSNVLLLLSLILGLVSGLYFPLYAKKLSIFAKFYVNMLDMCLVPIIITGVPIALSRLIKMKQAKEYFKRMMFVYISLMIAVSFFGIVVSYGAHFIWPLSADRVKQVAEIIIDNLTLDMPDVSKINIGTLLYNLVPKNVYSAISSGDNFGVMFFAVMFGVALGFLPMEVGGVTMRVFRGSYQTIIKIISGILYVLPLGMFFLVGRYVVEFPVGMWVKLGPIVIVIVSICSLAAIIQLVLISYRVKVPFWRLVNRLRSVILVSLLAYSAFAVLPLVLRIFEQDFEFDAEKSSLFYPLGVTLNPTGAVLFFSAFGYFSMMLYGYHPGIGSLIALGVMSILVTVPLGSLYYNIPHSLAYIMFSVILHPFGLPSSGCVLIVIAGTLIFMPFVNLVNVMGNCLSLVLILRKEVDSSSSPETEVISESV